jgi:hypothetical protein
MPRTATRFTISRLCARGIEKSLDELFEALPRLRENASQFAEMVESDDDQAYWGQIAIAAAGIVFAAANEDESRELANLDLFNDETVPPWVDKLVKFHNHGDLHPWGNPTLAMLKWAKQMSKKSPPPDGEDAFEALCDAMGIDVSDRPIARAEEPRASASEPPRRVAHAKFGAGTVVGRFESSYEVLFDSGEKKRIKPEYLKDI